VGGQQALFVPPLQRPGREAEPLTLRHSRRERGAGPKKSVVPGATEGERRPWDQWRSFFSKQNTAILFQRKGPIILSLKNMSSRNEINHFLSRCALQKGPVSTEFGIPELCRRFARVSQTDEWPALPVGLDQSAFPNNGPRLRPLWLPSLPPPALKPRITELCGEGKLSGLARSAMRTVQPFDSR
jgi:hypothetical protein